MVKWHWAKKTKNPFKTLVGGTFQKTKQKMYKTKRVGVLPMRQKNAIKHAKKTRTKKGLGQENKRNKKPFF